jgi:hypothetical protein
MYVCPSFELCGLFWGWTDDPNIETTISSNMSHVPIQSFHSGDQESSWRMILEMNSNDT